MSYVMPSVAWFINFESVTGVNVKAVTYGALSHEAVMAALAESLPDDAKPSESPEWQIDSYEGNGAIRVYNDHTGLSYGDSPRIVNRNHGYIVIHWSKVH